jgi:hypothetical protein
VGWIRAEDDFYDNDKMLAAGSIGRDLYWHGLGYCNRNLTDGLVPKRRALSLVDFTDAAVVDGHGGVDGQACAPIAVKRLLDADLWHEDGHDCKSCSQPGPSHYIIHDYLKYQPSRATVEAKRDEAKERMSNARNARSKNVRANFERTAAEVRVTPNPNPNPTLVNKGGEITEVSANDPPPICSKHGETNSDTPCRPCKKRREWSESQAQAYERDQLEERRRLKELRDRCPACSGTNLVEIRDGLVVKCQHGAAVSHA